MSAWTGRRSLVVAAIAAVVIAATTVLALRPAPPSGLDLSDVPAEALTPDLVAAAVDGLISEADLAHDSRSDAYRQPFGSVPAGTEVTLLSLIHI